MTSASLTAASEKDTSILMLRKNDTLQEYCERHYRQIILKLITHECVVDHCRSRPAKEHTLCRKHLERQLMGLPMWLPEDYCKIPGCPRLAESKRLSICGFHRINPEQIDYISTLTPEAIEESEITLELGGSFEI